MSIIGIDFGTSFCTASWCNPKTNTPEAIMFPNAVNYYKIPSLVMFPAKGTPIVGYKAYMQLEHAASAADSNLVQTRTVTSIKRKMQRNGSFLGHSHQSIIAQILSHVVKEAQSAVPFPEPPDRLVLTHPVIFDEWKKTMLKAAAIEVGFSEENITLLEEPVSAALAYIKSNPHVKVRGTLVYDFGGGTFDVAYVQIDHHGKPQMPIDPDGDPLCGGDDIDLLIYDKWDKLAMQQFHRHLTQNTIEADLAFLSQCRKQKELLTSSPNERLSQMMPVMDGHGLERCEWNTTEAEYNSLISPIIDTTITKTASMLKAIQQKQLPLDVVLLIGGSSRIPQVHERLTVMLGGDNLIKTTGQIDTAVSVGAVFFALEGFTKPQPKTGTCFCTNCGNKILSSDVFCMYCGTKNIMYL